MAGKKINILFIIDYFHGTGGTERHLTHLVHHLRQDIFSCSVVIFDLVENRWVDSIRAQGVPVVHIPVGREYTPSALVRASELSNFIRNNRFDIVQTFHQKSDTFAAVITKLSGIKHIVSSKRDIGQLKRPRHFFVNRLLRSLFERVIVVADAVADVVALKEQMPRNKIVKIYNGVDEQAFSPSTFNERMQARTQLGFADDDFLVGMVARMHPNKNFDVFLEGAMKALEAIPSLKILAVGGGPLLEYFRENYRSEVAESVIFFPGDVSDVTPYMRALDVGCLVPGNNEGFSNSIIEMMAMGLPMIVTDVGGNAEAVIDGQNGMVIPPRDSDALCSGLTEIYRHPEMRLEMGRKSRQLVEERFTLRQMCVNHENLYLSLLQ